MGRIWIVTGSREAGKTRFCESLSSAAKTRGCRVTGVLCPAGFTGSKKTSIEARNLATGEQIRLATLNKKVADDTQMMKWDFNENAMKWADAVFGSGVSSDLLIIDELGPLEFIWGKGWQKGLQALDKGNFKTAVVVIRPELIAQASQRWPNTRLIDISPELDRETCEDWIEKILSS